VEYSSDNTNLIDIQKTYIGVTNSNYGNIRFYDYISFHIKARYIRLFPKTWNEHGSLRVGILIDSEENIKTNCLPLQKDVFYDKVKKIIKPYSAFSSINCRPCLTGYLPNYERTECILQSTTEKYILVNNYFHSCDIS